jgi:hypothetical protein
MKESEMSEGDLIESVVEMFGQKRLCFVEHFGFPMKEYPKSKTLWVERAEDYYGQSSYRQPYCILTREEWLAGTLIANQQEKP